MGEEDDDPFEDVMIWRNFRLWQNGAMHEDVPPSIIHPFIHSYLTFVACGGACATGFCRVPLVRLWLISVPAAFWAFAFPLRWPVSNSLALTFFVHVNSRGKSIRLLSIWSLAGYRHCSPSLSVVLSFQPPGKVQRQGDLGNQPRCRQQKHPAYFLPPTTAGLNSSHNCLPRPSLTQFKSSQRVPRRPSKPKPSPSISEFPHKRTSTW